MKRWSSGPAIELVPQRLAVDERHHIIKEGICFARIEERQDVRVLEIGGGRDLLEKPLGAEDRREFRPQHLHPILRGWLRVVPVSAGAAVT